MTRGSDGQLTGRRALVVEDDEAIAELWTQVLEAEGCEVRRQESALGVAGLLRQWRPDVILLDLGLPYRSGATLLAELKADAETAPIPVVVLSGAPESLTAERAELAAAVLGKPVSLGRLRQVVQDAIAGTLRRRWRPGTPGTHLAAG
jgi:CheY-like chemotaxis protein